MKSETKHRIANKRIEIIIKDYFKDIYYIEETNKFSLKYKKKDLDMIRVYEAWAIDETLQAIYSRPSYMTVLDAVENFRSKMSDYSCKGSYIFAIAYDTATCILDALIYAGYH